MAHSKRHLVIVVGAGMAGLSAAQHLTARGLSDVLVLEAGDRIGGRIHTRSFGVGGKGTVEMGANYVEGTALTNSAIALANERGLLEITPAKYKARRASGYFYRPDGRAIDSELATKAWDTFQSWLEFPDTEPIRNLKMYFRKRFEDSFKMSDLNRIEKEDIKALYNHFLKWFMNSWGGPVDDVSLRTPMDSDIPGWLVRVTGISSLVNALRSDLNEGQIKLNHEVTKISLKNGTVGVECSNGAVFVADHVIVTCSLGYLKQNAMSMFNPPLPPDKMAAIQRIGFGKIGKIYLEYARPFWTKGDGRICLAWTDEELAKRSDSDWPKSIGTIDEEVDTDNVLSVWVTRDGVEAMERDDDESIKLKCTKVLRQFLRNPSIPLPVKVLKTDWATNPLFRGAYSYFSNVTGIEDYRALATPITQNGTPTILFAGEAVSGNPCIQDARETGLRQAEVILGCHGLSLSKL